MACGCSKKDPAKEFRMTSIDSTGTYKGPCSSAYFFLVGRGTPEEKLFDRDSLAEATAWSIENMRTIVSVKGGSLPAEAVEPLCHV